MTIIYVTMKNQIHNEYFGGRNDIMLVSKNAFVQ